MNAYQIGLITQSLISVISVAGLFALTSLGGMFSLGQAAYLCIGAYATFMLRHFAGMPLIVAAACSVVISALVAWGVGLLTLKLRRDYFALMSIALGQAVTSLVVVFRNYTGGAMGFTRIPRIAPINLMLISLAVAVLVLFCIRNFKYSRFGRMNLAQKNDEIAAKSFGINAYELRIKTYILAAIIGAIAGVILALRARYIDNTVFTWALSVEMLIFLFFGGTNSITGAAISAFILKLLPSLLREITIFGQSMESYRIILYCVLIIIFLNFRPAGLMGEREFSPGFFKNIFVNTLGKLSKRKRDAANE